MKPHVFIVDDDRDMCEMLATALENRGYTVDWYTSGEEAVDRLHPDRHDVVLTDLELGGMRGVDLCTRLMHKDPDLPVIVMTAFGSMESAVEAIRAGAYDFIVKPVEIDPLVLALDRATQHRQLRREVRRLRRIVEESEQFGALLGESPRMKRMYELVAQVAQTDVPVLITGETGTGKELVARVLHQRSRRAQGPFVAVNCAAMPEALLESELFGHARGAFTDAKEARPGLFLQAHAGTIFLDEIGDMPLELQPKLLRALEDRRVRPVGADAEQPFDARLLAATNKDLESAVEDGDFREDLFFRIDVVHLALPPLRARGNDVLLLAQHFIQRFAERTGKRVFGLTSTAAERLLAYDWPGNVRELQNWIERAVALTRYERITVEDLPEKVREEQAGRPADLDLPAELLSMEEVERRHVLRVLEAVEGNKTEAARILGFDRKTLYRKLERYGA